MMIHFYHSSAYWTSSAGEALQCHIKHWLTLSLIYFAPQQTQKSLLGSLPAHFHWWTIYDNVSREWTPAVPYSDTTDDQLWKLVSHPYTMGNGIYTACSSFVPCFDSIGMQIRSRMSHQTATQWLESPLILSFYVVSLEAKKIQSSQ